MLKKSVKMNYPFLGHRPAINRLSLNFLTIWEARYVYNSILLTYVDTLTNHDDNPLISNMRNQYSFCWRRFKNIYHRAAGLLVVSIAMLNRLQKYAEWCYQCVSSNIFCVTVVFVPWPYLCNGLVPLATILQYCWYTQRSWYQISSLYLQIGI